MPGPPSTRRWRTFDRLAVQHLKQLAEKAKRDAFVLHSLPRMDELTPDVDESRWGRYWVEAFNGVVMRMSLLSLILGAAE